MKSILCHVQNGGGVLKGPSYLPARVRKLLQASLAGYLALADDYL